MPLVDLAVCGGWEAIAANQLYGATKLNLATGAWEGLTAAPVFDLPRWDPPHPPLRVAENPLASEVTVYRYRPGMDAGAEAVVAVVMGNRSDWLTTPVAAWARAGDAVFLLAWQKVFRLSPGVGGVTEAWVVPGARRGLVECADGLLVVGLGGGGIALVGSRLAAHPRTVGCDELGVGEVAHVAGLAEGLVVVVGAAGLCVFDAPACRVIADTPRWGACDAVTPLRDGSVAWSTRAGTIERWDWRGGHRHEVWIRRPESCLHPELRPVPEKVTCVAGMPDGSIAAGCADGRVYVVSCAWYRRREMVVAWVRA